MISKIEQTSRSPRTHNAIVCASARANSNVRCGGGCACHAVALAKAGQPESTGENYGDFLGVGRYSMRVSLRYSVVLHKSKEGYAVSCPALPGCWSQGASEEEAVENIRGAIGEYLAAIKETLPTADVREVEVIV